MSVLIGTLAVALFNASKDPIARNFAYFYAVLSVGILVRVLRTISLVAKKGSNPPIIFFSLNRSSGHRHVLQLYAYVLYQHRITMIRRRDPGPFGASSICYAERGNL